MINIEYIEASQAEKVLLNPEIYDRISDDDCPLILELPEMDYLGGFVDGELASVTIFHPFRDGMKIHFNVLKEYRSKADFLLDASMVYDCPIYVEIPTLYPEVINYAKHHGFKEISRRFNTYRKNGKLYDRVLLWDS